MGMAELRTIFPVLRRKQIEQLTKSSHQSCGSCPTCKEGYRQYCSQARGFAFSDTDQGSLGDYRIINSEFAYAIPDSIASKHAAPLMCAGASTYEALDAGGARSGSRVGVLGIGGLGHMAIQFAKAMGCDVTALSNGPNKAPDAFKLGADEFRDTNKLGLSFSLNGESGKLESREAKEPQNINTLLITSNVVPELSTLLPLLARRATIVLMTIQQDSLTVPYMPFVLPGHKLIASTEASLQNHEKMLQFVAEKGIEPWVEEYAMDGDGVERAFQKLESGQMRYRGVLVREDAEGAQW